MCLYKDTCTVTHISYNSLKEFCVKTPNKILMGGDRR